MRDFSRELLMDARFFARITHACTIFRTNYSRMRDFSCSSGYDYDLHVHNKFSETPALLCLLDVISDDSSEFRRLWQVRTGYL
jgi:hypothetical protein